MKKLLLLLTVTLTAVFSAAADQETDQYITSTLQRMGSPATVLRSGTWIRKSLGGHNYMVTKAMFNNWTMGGINYGEITMGVVFSFDDNWVSFLPPPNFQQFLAAGDRSLLYLPSLSVD